MTANLRPTQQHPTQEKDDEKKASKIDWDNIYGGDNNSEIPVDATAVGTFETASQCYGKSDFEGAAKQFIICLHCAEKDDNTILQARAAANLASVFEMIGEEEMAIKVWVYGGYMLARTERGEGKGCVVQRALSLYLFLYLCLCLRVCLLYLRRWGGGGWSGEGYCRYTQGPFVSVPMSV